MSNGTFEIDLGQLQAEVSQLSQEEFAKQLLKTRTSQKKTQMKQAGSESAKKAAAKARERNKLFKTRALEMPATTPGFANLWEQIEAQAAAEAKAKLEEEAQEEE